MSNFQQLGTGSVPPIVKNLIIINAIVFFAMIVLGNQFDFMRYLALHSWDSVDEVGNHLFKPWQVITTMFMHGGNLSGAEPDYEGGLMHLFLNMLGLWMFGSVLENRWGGQRFLYFYLLCGVCASIAYLIGAFAQNTHHLPHVYESAVGASGAVYGLLGAYAYLFPNTYLYLYFMFPVKVKYLVGFYAIYELVTGLNNSASDNVAHFAHLGGLVIGFIIVWIWNKTDKRHFY
jgi:membrane associated rhomboid family serine protease